METAVGVVGRWGEARRLWGLWAGLVRRRGRAARRAGATLTAAPAAAPRRGFTLVELLMVIAIIGILVGLISSALVYARAGVKQARIKYELKNLDMALRQYQELHGEYPPDCSALINNNYAEAEFIRHLTRAYPRLDPALLAYNNPSAVTPQQQFVCVRNYIYNYYGIDIYYLSPQSAMVFWLGGLPQPGTNGKPMAANKLVYFSTNPSNPFDGSTTRQTPLFEFDTTRIVVDPNDPGFKANPQIPQYPPLYGPDTGGSGNPTPYVYFRARANGNSTPTTTAGVPQWGYDPYAAVSNIKQQCQVYYSDGSNQYVLPVYHGAMTITTTNTTLNAAASNWYQPNAFQVLSAGLDGYYGLNFCLPLGSYNSYPSTPNTQENDDLTNFLQGTFADIKPGQ